MIVRVPLRSFPAPRLHLDFAPYEFLNIGERLPIDCIRSCDEIVFVATHVLLFAAVSVSQEIPAGTIPPVMTSTTVDVSKSKPGDRISGKLMQDVVLPSGERIRSGARVEGQVIQAAGQPGSGDTHLSIRVDRLIAGDKNFPIRVSLRALASMQDVFNAQLPVGTFDEYGTSISDWTTVQVGGAAVYLGDGTVRDGMQIIGKAPGYGIVTAKLVPAPKLGCKANPETGQREQSLWVFSPWACGTYGFDDLKIAHHRMTRPVGSIELSAPAPFRVRAGSGWLLLVVVNEGSVTPASGE